jgi:glucose/arabinose dehydrogenase
MALAIAASHPHRSSATPTPGERVSLVKVTSARVPVDIATRKGDPGLYIAEQDGLVIRYDATTKNRTTALDLTRLTRVDAERGLLGLVFHPDGTYLYVNYIDSRFSTVVARYAMRSDSIANPSTRTVLFTLPRSRPSVHNGGSLGFGPGGRLFVSTGDSGFGNDPARLALDPSSFFGKILSVEPLARNAKSADPKIWSIGLRNPWRFEFDDEMNLWVPDVGQQRWEEINVVWAKDGSGRNTNFGWSAFEGLARNNKDQTADGHHKPVYVYEHGDRGCSVIGGTRIRDEALPSLRGWYVFGDYCTGRVTALKVAGQKVLKMRTVAKGAGLITAIRSVQSGEVYVLSLGGGIRRLRADN